MTYGAFQQGRMTALNFQPMMYMEEYLAGMEASGLNSDYIRTVRNGLSHLADFMRSEGVIHPEEITRLHLVRFQGNCNSRDWSKSYTIQVLKKARSWLNWMETLGYIESNPWQQMRLGSVPKAPKPLSDEDMTLLFAAHRATAFSARPFSYHRRELILCLLYGWGLRIHELEALNVANMDMRLDFVVARNKGGGSKTLPYTPEIKKIVARYLTHRTQFAVTGEDALLIANSGHRLPKEAIRTIVTELGQKAGVAINPHRLRDTCGTHLLDSDVPVERVQKILGHANLKQTLAYSRVNDRKVLESAEEAMDPRLVALFHNTKDLL